MNSFTYLLMDFIIFMLLHGVGPSTCRLDYLSITPLGWSCPLMDIMVFWSSFRMNHPFVDLYSLDSSFIMNPSTCGLIVLTHPLGWTRPLVGLYSLDSSLMMNPSTCALIILTHPLGWTLWLMDLIILDHPLGWTRLLMDFNKLQGILLLTPHFATCI